MSGMGIRTMLKKIVKFGIASVLLLTGCSSKVSASSASVAENVKTEVKRTSKEKTEKKSEAAEKKEQSSGTETKTEEKKTDKKAEAKSDVSGKSDTKKDTSQSKKSAGTASSQASGSNKTKSSQQKATSKSRTSSSKEQSASTSQHVHNWEYVKPTSHSETRTVVDKEAWDETVTDQAEWVESTEWIVCNGCGYKTQSRDEFMDHAAFSEASPACGSYHIDTVDTVHPAVTHTVHHDAVTHEITVEVADGFGYYKCSCGATKEGW